MIRRWFALFCVFSGAVSVVLSVTSHTARAAGDDYPYSGAQNCSGQYGPYSWCVEENGISGFQKSEWLSPRLFAYRNCTDWVAWRLSRINGVPFSNTFAGKAWGNANNWDDAARAAGYSVNNTPSAGAVAQTDRGAFGHVAWVLKVNAGGTVTVQDYNYSGTGRWAQRTVPSSTYRYIHIRDLSVLDSSEGSKFYGDWDGNGTVTPGVVYREANGLLWKLRNSNTPGSSEVIFYYGATTDTPVVGNWDGSGGDSVGIVRRDPTGLLWKLRNSTSSGSANLVFYYGAPTDIPVVGNWDGSGGDSVGIVRRGTSELQWKLRNSVTPGPAEVVFNYGATTDAPVVGNWDGSGGDSVGIVRRGTSELQWKLRNSVTPGPAEVVFNYGATTDRPVAGDWDGNGGDSIGIIRKGTTDLLWKLRNSVSPGPADIMFNFGGLQSVL